jgi:hypothetical protein
MLEIHLTGKNTEKRQNRLLHTPSPQIASQLHEKWRNQEGSFTTPNASTQTTWEDADHKVS